MKLSLFLLVNTCAWAQIQPSLGVMLDENNRARAVMGAPAAATLGEILFGGPVISLACSDNFCLAKTESALVSSSGDSVAAPPGAALIALVGNTAYIYFVETRQLVLWDQGKLSPVDFSPDGDVLSLRAIPGGFEFAIARDGGIWVGTQNLGTANSILLLDDGSVLLAADGQVRLLRPDGTETDFTVASLPDGFIGGFVRMSGRYVQVITNIGMWILDVTPGREQIFLLPGVSR